MIDDGGFVDFGSYTDGVAILTLGLKFGAGFVNAPLAHYRVSENTYSALTMRDINTSLKYITNRVNT